MPGPVPKDPRLRQRRNRVSTAATLPASGGCRRAPPLPAHRDWHPLTRAWWRSIWRSPMSAEWLPSDLHGLVLLADLRDRYWTKPTVMLAGEIRQQEARFGLSPIDRRRLQWTIERVEEAQRKRRPAVAEIDAADDPRKLLQVVS